MTKQEKILREVIRKEIKKELKEFDMTSVKKGLGRAAQRVSGTLRAKFGQLGKILEPMKSKLQKMGSTQKLDFLAYLIGDVAQVDSREFDTLKQRVSRVLDRKGVANKTTNV